MKYQKKVNGYKRRMMHPWLSPEIRKEIKRTAREFDVSESFVMAVALAEVFGIKKQQRY